MTSIYSAAGELYYDLGIDAWDFEIGNDLRHFCGPAVTGRPAAP
ncbi:hypothetical protein [Actinoplanes subtropicus]|nr:hypothetical protein [Actinoplanes subtropicus]